MRTILVVLPILFATGKAVAQDPATAINEARTHIAARRYVDAVNALKGAMEAADQLTGEERKQALAAVHFYLAVGYSGSGDDLNAVKHIEELLHLSPNARITAPSKYEAHFVELFNSVSHRLSAPDTFDALYPGFWTSSPQTPRGVEPIPSVDTPALPILGSQDEKREWSTLMTASERQRFLEDFWKRRDPNHSSPENEFRDTFNRRVAFADQAFASQEQRGSFTDRGKVFVLLGPPTFARRRPITNRDRIWIAEAATINGTIEHWVYTREQLPVKTSKTTVMYRFVTQTGIGDGVLQRESALAMQALAVAANPNAAR
jgi:GWxTD domain-containing protein